MRIPHYWAQSSAEDVDPDGQRFAFSCWRSSDISVDDARQSALQVARRTVARWITEGWQSGLPPSPYGYASQPLREEVLERIQDHEQVTIAAVTENAYGTLVLNSARVMFIDLDFPPQSPFAWPWYYLQRMAMRQVPTPEESRERSILAQLEQFLQREPGAGLRLYRTFAGMRAIVTHKLYDPEQATTSELLDSLGTDPLYVRLCKSQGSFRARLSPKPWRCGHHANRTRWPRQTQAAQKTYERWQTQYVKMQAGFATCRYLQTLGSTATHPEVARLVEIHDRITKCDAPLPLA